MALTRDLVGSSITGDAALSITLLGSLLSIRQEFRPADPLITSASPEESGASLAILSNTRSDQMVNESEECGAHV
jgi:hypothetical protein